MPFFLILFLMFFGLLLGVFLWEKHVKWPYVERTIGANFTLPEVCQQFKESRGLEANELNFKSLGTRYDGKGEMYKVEYDFYVSPDSTVLAIIGAGSILGKIVCGMWLYSKSVDNRVYATVTHQDAVQHDLSGLIKDSLISTQSLKTAYNNHMESIKKDGTFNSKFSRDRELEDLKQFLDYRLEVLRHNGLIYYCDDKETYWRYSFNGATKMVINQFFIGLFRMPYSHVKAFFKNRKKNNKTDSANRSNVRGFFIG